MLDSGFTSVYAHFSLTLLHWCEPTELLPLLCPAVSTNTRLYVCPGHTKAFSNFLDLFNSALNYRSDDRLPGRDQMAGLGMALAPDELPNCSSLTTKELQQNLRAVKQRECPIRLLFEIPSSRIIEEGLSKYVVYDVVVMRSGSFDSRRVSVERRYSDFYRFHHKLLVEFREELEDVVLPRKHLTGNFSPEIISERRVALQDYLAKLYSVRCVRHSPLLPKFLTEQEQRRAHSLLRAGQFELALQQLQVVLEIEEKLLPWQSPTLIVPTLCALAVCYRDLEEPEQASAAAQRALPPARRYGLKQYRASLLDLLVDLGYQMGRPVAQLQEELTVLRDAERGESSSRSLKELVVQEFI